MDAIQQLQQYIEESNRIVFFGGAGVSTESGIKDFRSVDGLYHMKYKYNPETILSRSFFTKHTDEFFEFYHDKIVQPTRNAAPNTAHKVLAQLEAQGKLSAVITQNIDGLHQMAGSQNVLELHGSIHRNYCMNCGAKYTLAETLTHGTIPHCECGGLIRPEVVLYEEPLNDTVITKAIHAISSADLLIVGGTSLTVYPATGFLDFYQGSKLVVINLDSTGYDSKAALTINGKIGEVLGQLTI
ncbi:MAG: NAD-dependent protein deacylase [Peptococcaceae bacterium]|nr:NAD-dependent protein deacylase [Peptococcaceae bacterium]